MKICDLYKAGSTVVSFEIFPPKKDAPIDTVFETVAELSSLKPDFISVTYGAGGFERGTSLTAEVAQRIKTQYNTESLAHFTCAQMSAEDAMFAVGELKGRGLENVLVLKGDAEATGGYRYAKDLISALKNHALCLGAAAYPEGHITCENVADDILHLRQKQDSGADFLITQLFFDNAIFYRFLDRARGAGIDLPISAGVMPILSKNQIQRMIFMCGASLPAPIIKMINKYGDEGESLVKAGVEYSCQQMQDLADNGVQGIHIYTMNKPFIAKFCMENLDLKRI